MKIRKTSRKKNKVALITLAALVLAGVAGVYFYNSRSSDQLIDENGVNYSPATSEQKKAGEDAKEQAIAREDSDSAPQPTAPEAAKFVSFSSSHSSEKNEITVTTSLDNRVSWNKCTLVLTQGSTTKSFDARTVYQPTNSFCGGFTVSSSGMSGTWQVKLQATSLEGSVYEKTDTITIN